MISRVKRCRFAFTFSLMLAGAMSVPALAGPLPPPEGDVMLRMTGDIEHPNMGDELHLDRTLMMSLSPSVIETETPWTEGVGRFKGPLVRAILDAAGARGDTVRVRALNGFEAEIPVTDFHDYDVILAIERDGEAIAVRDLGPVFILYPFDDHPELLTETIRFRSVWHVGTLHVP